MRVTSVIITILGCLVMACRPNYYTIDTKTLATRTLTSIGGTGQKLHATYYPVSHQSSKTYRPIILLEPVLLDRRVLHRGDDGGLVAWLNFKGYPVWVVHTDNSENLHAAWQSLGQGLLQKLSKFSGQKKYYLGGLSLGGRGLLVDFVKNNSAPNPTANDGFIFERIFFFATAFDYNYPGSFFAVTDGKIVPGKLAPQLKAKCTEDQSYCRRFTLFESKSTKWMGTMPPREVVPNIEMLRQMKTPVLFMVGKSDNIAPSEAVYGTYLAYGQTKVDAPFVDQGINRMFLSAGHGNHFTLNFDHLDMFLASEAEGTVYQYLHNWLQNKI